VTTRDSVWTDQDRTELLAYLEYEASLCPCGCGHMYEDSTSNWETGPEFDATVTTCRARAALLEAQRAKTAGENAPALIWATVLKRE
jgi:hypothetical protein